MLVVVVSVYVYVLGILFVVCFYLQCGKISLEKLISTPRVYQKETKWWYWKERHW